MGRDLRKSSIKEKTPNICGLIFSTRSRNGRKWKWHHTPLNSRSRREKLDTVDHTTLFVASHLLIFLHREGTRISKNIVFMNDENDVEYYYGYTDGRASDSGDEKRWLFGKKDDSSHSNIFLKNNNKALFITCYIIDFFFIYSSFLLLIFTDLLYGTDRFVSFLLSLKKSELKSQSLSWTNS